MQRQPVAKTPLTLADAVDAWQRGMPAAAEQAARAVIARDPRDLNAHGLLLEILSTTDRREEAIGAARSVLELAPGNAAVHRRLAELLSRGGDLAGAVESVARSLEMEPDNPRALNNLGHWLTVLGRLDEALGVLLKAVDRHPGHAAAWTNLGIVRAQQGRRDEAIGHYRRALALNPRSPEAHWNLGGNYVSLGRHAEALDHFESALALAPDRDAALLGRVHALLGLKRAGDARAACEALLTRHVPPQGIRALHATALLAEGRHADARQAAAEAVKWEPDDSQAFITLGFSELGVGHPEAALDAFDRALGLAPSIAKTHLGRGNALEALGRGDEAVEAYDLGARLDPTDPTARLACGQILLTLGFGTDALAALDAVLQLDAGHLAAKEARAMALMALGRHEDALAAFVELTACGSTLPYLPGYRFFLELCCCDWRGYERGRREVAAGVASGEPVDAPLSFLAHSTSPELQLRCAMQYVSAQPGPRPGPVRGAARPARDRLRVGYLSFDFRNHPVGQLTAGLLERHDRTRFEVVGLSASPSDGSELRRRLVHACDRFEDITGLKDRAAAERIAALEIDVLVDLGGHTLGSRTSVLAYRPAPVQIAFLGFPGTLGAGFVDYIVADRHVIPEAEQRHYAEKVIYLPDTYFPLERVRQRLPCPTRREAGLPDDAFIYCCFNAGFKFSPEMFDAWMRILKAVPNGILWMREGSAAMRGNLEREAAARGADPQRLLWAPRVPTSADHLARFALADAFLDTTPYNAHTTAGEALTAGIPVITLAGRTFASRVATSLLHAVGLGALSATTVAQYERLAVQLAESPESLCALKVQLGEAANRAPLFNADRHCRHLESAFRAVVDRHRRGESPCMLDVPALP